MLRRWYAEWRRRRYERWARKFATKWDLPFAGIMLLAGFRAKLDACTVCRGARGGEPGNENIVDGVVMCDYCHADKVKGVSDERQRAKD